MKIGNEVTVTFLTYGGAVYDRRGRIINQHQRPDKSTRHGVIKYIGPECKNGVTVVCVTALDKKLDFQFYPHETGPNQQVDIKSGNYYNSL